MNLEELCSLIGGIPVSEQIMTAVDGHSHSEYATKEEVEDLKKKIELLFQLVGNVAVSDQILIAINNIK